MPTKLFYLIEINLQKETLFRHELSLEFKKKDDLLGYIYKNTQYNFLKFLLSI